ncbi:MAG: glycosyltransferase family 39 protein [Phycisphaerae bacterium]|nr:glycosyltransferase family 39 protein [Phycisphaerae bacterium]
MCTEQSNPSILPPVGNWTKLDRVLCCMVMLTALVVLVQDISVGGFRYGDAAAHAMDGVLIHDWIAAGPQAWLSPMQFAVQQYGHYPALGIGRHYPPGYALVESGFFALFGVSVFTARFCVACFGMLAAAGAYTFVRFLADRLTAVLAAVILVTMPATTTWGRQNMLEVPTLAVMIWAAAGLVWYLRQPSTKRLVCLAAVTVLAVLFKQPAMFLTGVVAFTLVLAACKGICRPTHAIAVVVIAVAVTTVTFLSLDGHGRQLLSGDATFANRFGLGSVTFYASQIPRQVSVPYLVAAMIGVLFLRRKQGLVWIFLTAWLIAGYALVTIADFKESRYIYLALFPIAVWSALAGGVLLSWVRAGRVRAALSGIVVCGCCVFGIATPVEHRPDYGPIVLAHRDKIEGHVVLFSGLRDGDFVFAVRQHIPWRRALVVRGSKLLYTCNCRPELDFVSKVANTGEVAELMARYAFGHIFVERENKLKLAEDTILRDYLSKCDAYRRVAVHPLPADPTPSYRDVTIDVYQTTEPRERLAQYVDIPIPRAYRTVRIDLSGWEKPTTPTG